jgi:RNA polymerase sigma-70 factor (ECF subfamily)
LRSDEELAEDVRAGDQGAYALLYERYRRPLYLFGVRMVGGAEAGLDLVQETFLGFWERRRELERLRSFRGWLFTIARNRCLTLLRQRQTRARLDALAESDCAEAQPASGGLEAEEESRLVRRAVAELPLEQREVLVLREYLELSYREIAEITGATESAVKARLFRARQALADRLRPALTGGEEP